MAKFIIIILAIIAVRFFFLIIFWNAGNKFYRSFKGGIWQKRKYGAERQGHTFWEKSSENPKGNYKIIKTETY